MSTLSRFATAGRRGIVMLTLLLTLWLSGAGDVWAKGKKPDEPTGPVSKSYVLPYGLVMFAVMLGMIAVCRPGRRADDPPRQDKPVE